MGDLEAQARLIVETIRATGRDPRANPAPGDEVTARTLARPARNYGGEVQREVLRLWPGRLAISLPVVDAAHWGDIVTPPTWLKRGTPVLSSFPLSFETRDGERRPVTWDVVATLRTGGPWVRVVTAEEPEVYSTDNVIWRDSPPLPVEVVEWVHRGATRGRRPQRSTIDAWRRWAKGGTVLRLGGES